MKSSKDKGVPRYCSFLKVYMIPLQNRQQLACGKLALLMMSRWVDNVVIYINCWLCYEVDYT